MLRLVLRLSRTMRLTTKKVDIDWVDLPTEHDVSSLVPEPSTSPPGWKPSAPPLKFHRPLSYNCQ